jgi:prenyltransferase/squalene oxidase-like repeat protein
MAIADDVRDVRRERFMEGALAFVLSNPLEWSLDTGNVELEVTNHVLRVFIQNGTIGRYENELHALCALQHADGGWGDFRDDPVSHARSSAFCVQMLLRAHRQCPTPAIRRGVERGIAFIMENQRDDGSWLDHRWHTLDAVSTSLGCLLFAANDDAFASSAVRNVISRATDFVDRRRQPNGLWYYKPTSSPVTITAHLMQKTSIFHGANAADARAVAELLARQDEAGHWDSENVDHTCDASRSLMLVASRSQQPDQIRMVAAAAERATDWLLSIAADGRLGDRPRRRAHVERTCDGLDTMLKYVAFLADHSRMAGFWH